MNDLRSTWKGRILKNLQRRALLPMVLSAVVLWCDMAIAEVWVVREPGTHDVLGEEVNLRIFEEEGKVGFYLHGDSYTLGSVTPWIPADAGWFFYRGKPGEMWLYAGGDDLVRIRFRAHSVSMEDYRDEPDLIEHAPLDFLELLVEAQTGQRPEVDVEVLEETVIEDGPGVEVEEQIEEEIIRQE